MLAILAGCAGLARYNYDDVRRFRSSRVRSACFALDKISNLIIPEYLSNLDGYPRRRLLADLEQMVQRVSQVPRWSGHYPTRWTVAEQARTSWQAGEVGSKLDEGSKQIAVH